MPYKVEINLTIYFVDQLPEWVNMKSFAPSNGSFFKFCLICQHLFVYLLFPYTIFSKALMYY